MTSAGSVAFNPFVDEDVRGDIIAVTLPKNLKTFKAPLIAHYIAARRRTAEKVFGRLIESSGLGMDKPSPEVPASGKSGRCSGYGLFDVSLLDR